jgi:hypothetical protein
VRGWRWRPLPTLRIGIGIHRRRDRPALGVRAAKYNVGDARSREYIEGLSKGWSELLGDVGSRQRLFETEFPGLGRRAVLAMKGKAHRSGMGVLVARRRRVRSDEARGLGHRSSPS